MHNSMCIISMKFTWHEAKRQSNLSKHGLDFAQAYQVFVGETFTFEDIRFRYDERRFVTLGVLEHVVIIVHTETIDEIRIISMKKATKHEQQLYQNR